MYTKRVDRCVRKYCYAYRRRDVRHFKSDSNALGKDAHIRTPRAKEKSPN